MGKPICFFNFMQKYNNKDTKYFIYWEKIVHLHLILS